MKITTIIAAALASSALVAATPQEMLEAGDYVGFAKAYNYWDPAHVRLITLDNAKVIYDACLSHTNYVKAGQAAGRAWVLGNRSLIADLFESKVPPTETDLRKLPHIDCCGVADVDLSGKARMKLKNAEGREYIYNANVIVLEPNLMLAFCKRAKAVGNLDVAGLAFYGINPTMTPTPFELHMTSEWKEFLDSFTSEEINRLTDGTLIWHCYMYASKCDRMANDESETSLTRVFTKDGWKKVIEHNRIGISRVYSSKKFAVISALVTLENSPSVKIRIDTANWLDRYNKDKKASESIYSYVLENGTWSQTANLALYLNDNDKILDVYKKIGVGATADEVNAIIPIVNALDYNYRTADVRDILKNINAKYTLKLYDDRDTWEPILSKIRALIDAR